MPDHAQPQRLEQLADQVLDRLHQDADECPSCAASILIEALAKISTEAGLSPMAVIQRVAAAVVAPCGCDDCRREMN